MLIHEHPPLFIMVDWNWFVEKGWMNLLWLQKLT